MTIEDMLKLVIPIVVVLSPLFSMMFSINSRLAKIEQRLDLDKERIEATLNRHDIQLGETSTTINKIAIELARRGPIHEPL
jgi:hypothetical protein